MRPLACSSRRARLPRPLRVWAARRAVARLKHDGASPAARARGDLSAHALFAAALACSAALGYVAGEGEGTRAGPRERVAADRARPGIGAAHAAALAGSDHGRSDHGESFGRDVGFVDALAVDPLWRELGRVHAEILRLRILFRRLADVAELDDDEFDLKLDPLELPEVRDAADRAGLPGTALPRSGFPGGGRPRADLPSVGKSAPELDLSIRALDPISRLSGRMARIFDERRAAYDRRVAGPVVRDAVRTSGFGYRRSPFGGHRQLHRGVDLAGDAGAPVHALADGIVVYSGPNGSYGNLVELEHGDGYRTRYAHNESNLVRVGERVAKGSAVATLGSSGRSSGPHVHVEVHRHGARLDPAGFLR